MYHHGEPVVDLWAGLADSRTGAVWERDTVVPVFSASKGVTSLCAHLLAARGLLDLDAPVAVYWPQFAAAGKAECTVRWLLTHQAGLPVLDRSFTLDELRAVEPVLRALEAQAPKWTPGARVAYHPITFGFLVGELVRRVTGLTLGAFVRKELVDPLGLQMWLGLAPDEPVRPAWLEAEPEPPPSAAARLRGFMTRHSDRLAQQQENTRRSITLGGALPFELVTGQAGDFNDRAVLAAELGAANVVTDARSLARLYAATVCEVDGLRLMTDADVARFASYRVRNVRYWGVPPGLSRLLLARFFRMGLGFMVRWPLSATTFGHWGAGGSLGFAHLDSRIAFGYVVNRMERDPNARSKPLVESVQRSIATGIS